MTANLSDNPSNPPTKLLHADLTRQIIGVYYDVYNGLSRTYPEFIYENAMMAELRRLGIHCVRQDDYAILYKDNLVGRQILDIFVAEEVVVELKAQPKLTRLHAAQTTSYLKTTGKQVGLLFNFGTAHPEFKRVFLSQERRSPVNPAESPSQTWPGLLNSETSYRVIGALFEVHNVLGPGFVRRIYAQACLRELQFDGHNVELQRRILVHFRGQPIGEVAFEHLRIDSDIMVFPVAIDDTGKIQMANLRRWMAAEGVSLGMLANFYAPSLDLHFMVISS